MASQNTEQKNNLMVQMEYYQYNVCASCHPEDDFFAVVSDTISPIKQKYPYEIAVYNTFRAEDKKRFEKRLQELMLKEADVSLPTLIMISEDSEALVCLSGLDEIKEKLEDTLKQAAKPGQMKVRTRCKYQAVTGKSSFVKLFLKIKAATLLFYIFLLFPVLTAVK